MCIPESRFVAKECDMVRFVACGCLLVRDVSAVGSRL